MTVSPDLVDRLRAAFSAQPTIDLLRRMVQCASVTGDEAAIASLLESELRSLGADEVLRSPFAPGRYNVRGLRRATSGSAPTVLLVGHTDTVHVRGWAERWAGAPQADPFGAAILGDELWGRGTADMKVGIATALGAVELLDRAGIVAACTIQFAFVGDEESGELGSGVSAGFKALLPVYDEGAWSKPDLAIYGEPSSLDLYPAHMGFFIADLTIRGRSAYFGLPEQGRDALKAGHAVLDALWAHSDAIRARSAHPVIGPGFLVVTAGTAGGYIAVPGECRISLIRKLIPGEDLEIARQDLEAVIHGALTDPDYAIDITYPAGRDHPVGGTPLDIDPATAPIPLLAEAIRAVRPEAGNIGPCAGWSEGPFLAARGIPVVYFSPGDFVHCHTLEERVSLTRYADGIVALAAFLATYGAVPAPPLQPRGDDPMSLITLSTRAAVTATALLFGTGAGFAADATVGPHGEAATPSSALKLSDDEIAKLKAAHGTAALLWHTSSDFTNGVTAGAKDTFAAMGMEIVATTDAGFDSARQMNDVETITAKKPSAILALPLDPVGSAAAFKPAIAAGAKLVFLSNVPNGYTAGKDYVSVVTDDLHAMGSQAAEALAKAIGDKGKIGYIFHDAQYYVTNQRDQAFKSTIEGAHKGITIAESQGISDPARAEEIANAMLTKTPDLDGIYVTWAEPAEGVLAALRSRGNTHTKIVTLDLSEPVALDMAKGGNVAAIVADATYEVGRAMATAAGYGLLGKQAPAFVVAPAMTITKANLAQGYEDSLHREAPKSVLDALK